MIRFISHTLLVGLLVLSASFAFAALNDGLVVYLTFDEGNGKVAKDQSGNGLDAELLANNKWVDGQFGKGIEITAEGGDCVNVPADDALKIENEITIMAWVHSLGWVGSGDQWIDRNCHNGGELNCYGMGVFGDGGDISMMLGAGNARPTLTVPNSLEPEKWEHVAGTYDGSTMLMYINGEEAGKLDQKFAFAGTNDQDLRVGCAKDRPQYTFNGAIDEVAIYSRTLSLNEIEQVMNGDLLAVFPEDKLTTTWGDIKTSN